MSKVENYTAEQTAEIIAAYTAAPTDMSEPMANLFARFARNW